MSQQPKEQTSIAMWNAIRGELARMGVTTSQERNVEEITGALSASHGYSPEQVMAGLMEGVSKRELELTGTTVRLLH